MKVFLSALSCEPDRGSEPEVGFRTLLAAATEHEVWAITLSFSVERILQALQGDPRSSRIHLEGIDFGVAESRIDMLSAPEFHWYYDRWQRALSARALALDKEVDFDLTHHVTLASYWARAGVAAVPKPFVWGPVGGGVNPPLILTPALGARGVVQSMARAVGRPLMASRPSMRRTRRTAEVILAQNRATGRALLKGGKVTLLSNALAVDLDTLRPSTERNRDVLFVGRLLAWKAPMLALRAFRYVQTPKAVLVFCGQGPEHPRLERAIRRWGIADRVRFEGWLPRDQLLSKLARAGALLHPALHEEAGLCIAEALSFGTPVVCLDHGGPAEVVRQWQDSLSALVSPDQMDATARSMASAIDRFLADPPATLSQPQRPSLSFAEEVLSAYDSALSKFGPRDKGPSARKAGPTLTGQWIGLPSRSYARWNLPKAPSRAARSGLFVYHPVTLRGRMGWEMGKLIASLGLLKFLPSAHPPEDLCEALIPYLPPRSSLAVARTNHPGRYVALAVDDQGEFLLAAKLAKDQAGRAKLRREREQMETFSPLLPEPIRGPKVLGYDDGVLILEAVRWQARIVPWHLSEAVAHALGGFFKRTMPGMSHMVGAAHGDFAPWNLMLGLDGEWTLLDWEDARADAPPFFDVFHYLVQSNQELLLPRRNTIVNGISGRGWIGRAIRAYADGAGIPEDSAGEFFERYLRDSRASLDPLAPRRGVMVRRDLAQRLRASSSATVGKSKSGPDGVYSARVR
jgi:glycosyltransferase involved in cell wall biosynthesis